MNSQSSYAPSSTAYQSSSTTDQPAAMTDRESTAKSTATYQSSSMTGRGPSQATDPSQASSATVRGDPMRRAVHTDRAPAPLPFFSQAIVCNGMVYCSGQIGVSPITKQMVDGGVGDRTVGPSSFHFTPIPTDYRLTKAQALHNLSAVLEAAGSSLRNVVECNVFLTDMTNFAAMNRVYDTFFEYPKPVGHHAHSQPIANAMANTVLSAERVLQSRSCQ